jgi:hypothetical protein
MIDFPAHYLLNCNDYMQISGLSLQKKNSVKRRSRDLKHLLASK